MTFTPAKRRKSREKKLKTFDADKNGKIFDGIFGLPFDTEDSELVILPVPWDVASSNHGSSTAPEEILKASKKISLFREDNSDVWKNGIALHKIPKKWQESSQELIKISRKIKRNNNGSINKQNSSQLIELYKNVNYSNIILKEWVEDKCNEYLDKKILMGVLGGDHSVAIGFLNSLAKKNKNIGLLQIDAHSSLRQEPEGFDFSHNSFAYQALKIKEIKNIIQVSTRETTYAENKNSKSELSENGKRLKTYSDNYLKRKLFKGTTWQMLANEIISGLPKNVYLSIDIDALQQWLCPNSEKAVPGGMSFEELVVLISILRDSGKKIIGFDLCGVTPSKTKKDSWDAE
ncbi:MAG: arginase family protein, partial [Bacteroidota bacterium]|nr:arginase family protein [Bacteroidota bacterium]